MSAAAAAGSMSGRRFASRGGEKLDAALDALALDVTGRRALDAGASSGGFTDCLLSRGVREVVAVDVAYGQFDWRLRNDPRVRVIERTNVRSLDREAVGGAVDLVVADLSFISLIAVADALLRVAAPNADLVLLVKPQFELPRNAVPRGGVVRDPEDRRAAVRGVVGGYRGRGCVLAGAAPSSVPGPKGNREFFVWLRRAGSDVGDGAVERAVEDAP